MRQGTVGGQEIVWKDGDVRVVRGKRPGDSRTLYYVEDRTEPCAWTWRLGFVEKREAMLCAKGGA